MTSQTDKSVDPLGDGISSVELIRVSGSDLEVVNAARVSYGKESEQFSERDAKLIDYLVQHKHMSPFEHNQVSFRVKAPIYVVRQWMRHRICSYNEISYRYVKAPVEFYRPQAWRYQDPKSKQSSFGSFQDDTVQALYNNTLDTAYNAYEAMLAAGVCREQARGVLPVCTYTEFIFTCNLRSLMHFIELRDHANAQWEIQRYAQEMGKLVEPHFPASYAAFKKYQSH
jgi:thymidylate synthase (FAD)